VPEPAAAYVLNKQASCGGQRWDISRPVEVRFLWPTFQDYGEQQGWSDWPARMLDAVDDVKAVIDLYNSVPGSGLRLEYAGGYLSGDDIGEPEDQVWDDQTIVIGFTNATNANSATAEAWAPGDPDDGCTRTRAHILFNKGQDWNFGPPGPSVEDARHFGPGNNPITFLGILTHEMGHAVGLSHAKDDYAIMDQAFTTWFRGPNHVMRTQLLPDDMAGILALYGTSQARNHLDISVTRTWFASSADQADCSAEASALRAAERDRDEWQVVVASLPSGRGNEARAEYDEALIAVGLTRSALETCENAFSAKQRYNCEVSSRADLWADREDEEVLCGVNSAQGSSYAPASKQVCPNGQVQLRYTLNNHGAYRDADVQAEVWFSTDSELDVRRRREELQSVDVRETFVPAGSSKTVGQVFRVPSSAVEDEDYWVFVRAVPRDPATGERLWGADVDIWNNVILIRDKVTVSEDAC
jgi:hypothetical protein